MPFTIKTISNVSLKIRRFYVDPAITYDALVTAIATGFGCEDPSKAKLCISYIDCERDFVSVANTDDLRVAIDLFQEKQLLKLFVSPGCQQTEGAGACGSLACSKGRCTEGKCGKGKCGDKIRCPALKAIHCHRKTAYNYFRAKFPCWNKPAGPGGAELCGKPPGPPCSGFPGFDGPCGGGKKFCLKKWFKKLHGFGRRGGFDECGPCGGGPCGGKFSKRHGYGKHGGFGGKGRHQTGSDSRKGSSNSSSSSSGSGSYSSSGEN